ncbi:NADPH-dependent FMN reductase, partial [Streptomyces anulatus]|uniref:NADPH-dependent FMN reductase n=1 Tax=Streptomyces anulatus TaxID=1892 RepID=UPI003667C1C0
MTDTPLRLVVLIGSHREGRFAPTVARWLLAELEQHADFDVEVIDAAQAGLNAEGPSRAPPGPGGGSGGGGAPGEGGPPARVG